MSDPSAKGRPLAKPAAAESFVRAAASVRPPLNIESFEFFDPSFALNELDASLTTTGFEGFDRPASPASAIFEPPAAPILTIPVVRPMLEVKPPLTPIAVYEPMEFLDYDDEDDSFGDVQAAPEPEIASEPDFLPPPTLTSFLPIGIPEASKPATAKLQQGFTAIAVADLPVEVPEVVLRTVRRRFTYGSNPQAPKPGGISEVKPAPSPVQGPAQVSKPAQMVARPAPPKPAPAVTQRPAAAATAVPAIKAEPAARPQSPAAPEKDKRPVVKAAPATGTPAPARAVRDRGNAVPAEEVIAEAPAPALKPKMVPIRKPEPLAPAATVSDFPMMGMAQGQKSSGSKIGLIAAAVVVLAGGSYFAFSGKSSSAAAAGYEGASEATTAGMIIGGGGWTTTWGMDAPVNKGKQISIYRPSMAMPDYRLEFRGQIERKAMGWIFRASNPKNYYVMKLEAIKPGANPLVALVKYAVIDGKETTHTQVMLPFDVKADTVYQVRLDVRGEKFTTHVQGKLVDYWNDDRIKLGGTGFYTETGERSQIKSSQVSYLK